jgi:hypothetical protein
MLVVHIIIHREPYGLKSLAKLQHCSRLSGSAFEQLWTRAATTPRARALHRDIGDQRLVALVAAIMKS